MAGRRRVLVIGDVVTDVVAVTDAEAVHSGSLAVGSDTAARIRVMGGGSAANTAAWLASLGVMVDLVAVVGADAAGDERLAELQVAGVGCDWVRRTEQAPTGTVIVLAHASERSMLFDRGANLLLTPSDVDAAVMGSGAAHLHLSGYALLDRRTRAAGLHALRLAPQRRLTTSVDAASAAPLRVTRGAAFVEWVRGVDLLLANLDEALALLDADADADPAAVALALTEVARHVVVKLGSRGAMLAGVDGVAASVPAEPASVVEPTGAGDAFAAGFLASWLDGGDASVSLTAGSRLGARAVSKIGGRP